MANGYWKFLKECLSATYDTWRRHEEATVIGSALLAFFAAWVTAYFIPLNFKQDSGQWILVLLGAWFVFLFVFASPYMLWRRQKNEIGELARRVTPLISVAFNPENCINRLLKNPSYFLSWRDSVIPSNDGGSNARWGPSER